MTIFKDDGCLFFASLSFHAPLVGVDMRTCSTFTVLTCLLLIAEECGAAPPTTADCRQVRSSYTKEIQSRIDAGEGDDALSVERARDRATLDCQSLVNKNNKKLDAASKTMDAAETVSGTVDLAKELRKNPFVPVGKQVADVSNFAVNGALTPKNYFKEADSNSTQIFSGTAISIGISHGQLNPFAKEISDKSFERITKLHSQALGAMDSISKISDSISSSIAPADGRPILNPFKSNPTNFQQFAGQSTYRPEISFTSSETLAEQQAEARFQKREEFLAESEKNKVQQIANARKSAELDERRAQLEERIERQERQRAGWAKAMGLASITLSPYQPPRGSAVKRPATEGCDPSTCELHK